MVRTEADIPLRIKIDLLPAGERNFFLLANMPDKVVDRVRIQRFRGIPHQPQHDSNVSTVSAPCGSKTAHELHPDTAHSFKQPLFMQRIHKSPGSPQWADCM